MERNFQSPHGRYGLDRSADTKEQGKDGSRESNDEEGSRGGEPSARGGNGGMVGANVGNSLRFSVGAATAKRGCIVDRRANIIEHGSFCLLQLHARRESLLV